MDLPIFLNQSQAARALGCDRKIIQRAEARGELHPIPEGKKKLYSRAEIIDLHIRRLSR